MKKTQILFLFLMCCQWMKPQLYNEQFPVGHYEQLTRGNAVSLDFFDNKQVLFTMTASDTEDSYPPFIYQAGYELRNDSIYLTPFKKFSPLIFFGRQNKEISQGVVVLELDFKALYLKGNLDDCVIAVGKNIKEDQFHNIDLRENSFEDELISQNLKAQPGDSLAIRIKINEKISTFYLKINSPINQIRVDASTISGELAGLPLVLFKGESNNEIIAKSVSNRRNDSYYFVRPLTLQDSEKIQQNDTPSKEGWEYISTTETNTVDLSYEDYAISMVEAPTEVEAVAPVEGRVIQPYLTSYTEALKMAKKENKFLRIYIAPKGDECTEKMKSEYESLGTDAQSYYYIDYSKLFSVNYVMAFLTESDEKFIKKLGFDYLPVHLIIAPDETLLYAESRACRNYDSENLLFKKESDGNFNKFYYQLVLKYNQDVTAKKIGTAGAQTDKALAEYLQTICKVANEINKGEGYEGYRFSEYFDNIYESDRLFKDPAFFPTSEVIGKYMDQYVERRMNAPMDTSLVRMLMQTYFPCVYDFNTETAQIPLSMQYLVKHRNTIQWMNEPWFENAPLNDLYASYDKMLSAFATSELTEEQIIRLYQDAMESFPEYKDFILFKYASTQSYLTGYEGSLTAEILSLFDPYLSGIINHTDLNAYLKETAESLVRLDPQMYATQFGEPDEDENGFRGSFHTFVAYLLNRAAWLVHEKKMSDYDSKALAWSESAAKIENDQQVYYLQDYAFYLYRTGQKEKAIEVQKSAYETLKSKNDIQGMQVMRTNLLSMIYDTFD